LTLQPIVENCVKHGRDPDGAPLHIRIQTRKTNSGSELLVEDNGPGYHPEDDDRPHIALKNIRERLEMMCGGTMTIRFREEGGTEVRITIPDQIKEGKRSRPEKDQRRAR
jgi:sensor histidine kinase YesM